MFIFIPQADRLFELGFQSSLDQIFSFAKHKERQSVLCSATMPKILDSFARAGLRHPIHFVRLDVESKLSPDLTFQFFSVLEREREAALILLLEKVLDMGTSTSVCFSKYLLWLAR